MGVLCLECKSNPPPCSPQLCRLQTFRSCLPPTPAAPEPCPTDLRLILEEAGDVWREPPLYGQGVTEHTCGEITSWRLVAASFGQGARRLLIVPRPHFPPSRPQVRCPCRRGGGGGGGGGPMPNRQQTVAGDLVRVRVRVRVGIKVVVRVRGRGRGSVRRTVRVRVRVGLGFAAADPGRCRGAGGRGRTYASPNSNPNPNPNPNCTPNPS